MLLRLELSVPPRFDAIRRRNPAVENDNPGCGTRGTLQRQKVSTLGEGGSTLQCEDDSTVCEVAAPSGVRRRAPSAKAAALYSARTTARSAEAAARYGVRGCAPSAKAAALPAPLGPQHGPRSRSTLRRQKASTLCAAAYPRNAAAGLTRAARQAGTAAAASATIVSTPAAAANVAGFVCR